MLSLALRLTYGCQICASLRPLGRWPFSLRGISVLTWLVVNKASLLVFPKILSADLCALVALNFTPQPPPRIYSCWKSQRSTSCYRHYRSQLRIPVSALTFIPWQIQLINGLNLVSSTLFGSDTVILALGDSSWPHVLSFHQISSSCFVVSPLWRWLSLHRHIYLFTTIARHRIK